MRSGVYSWLMYISLIMYQVKPQLSPLFSAACAAAIIHRNHFFRLHQQNKSSDLKVKFRQASNRCKIVLEAAKLAYATKTREYITSQKRGSRDFGELLTVFSTKVNLLYLLYSTTRRWCLRAKIVCLRVHSWSYTLPTIHS